MKDDKGNSADRRGASRLVKLQTTLMMHCGPRLRGKHRHDLRNSVSCGMRQTSASSLRIVDKDASYDIDETEEGKKHLS